MSSKQPQNERARSGRPSASSRHETLRLRLFERSVDETSHAPSGVALVTAAAIAASGLGFVALDQTALALCALLASLGVIGAAVLVAQRRKHAEARHLELEGDAIALASKNERHELLRLEDSFGVQLFADTQRSCLCAWIGCERGTIVLRTSIDASSRAALRPLLLRSWTLGDDDPTLEARGPDGHALALDANDLGRAIHWLEQRSQGCLDRIVISDQRGRPVRLEPSTLTVGGFDVRLDEPLEWHAGLFRERFGEGTHLYQGTWLSQGDASVVLVAPLTSTFVDAALGGLRLSAEAELDALARRDQSLLKATSEAPPRSESRVAIDATLVVPIRAALARAPRPRHRIARDRSLS